MLALRHGDTRILTDPVLDPEGSTYDFGLWFTPRAWFASEKRYTTPPSPAAAGRFAAVLLSHDHHADNLDLAGRALIADPQRVARVITTVPGARRLARPATTPDAPGRGLGLGDRVVGLVPGATTRVGSITITATVARHGPSIAPQVHEVIGFLLEVDAGPRIWISGDTVLFPELTATLAAIRERGPIDLAVVHCGAVGFPRVPGFRRSRFTFDAAEAIAACHLLDPTQILPIHRSGWAHFQQPEAELRAAFAAAGLGERTRFLELGASLSL